MKPKKFRELGLLEKILVAIMMSVFGFVLAFLFAAIGFSLTATIGWVLNAFGIK